MSSIVVTPTPAVQRRVVLLVTVLLLSLILAVPVLAQSGLVRVDDPDGLLAGGADVRAAAERLAREGADVVVVAVRNAGQTTQEAQAYLDDRLAELGIANSTRALRGNQIVFYVAPQPGYDGIYFVGRYRPSLEPVYQQILRQQARPLFTSGDLSGGMVAAIDGVRTTLNPPTSPVVYVLGGLVAAGVVGSVAVPALRRRGAAADLLGTARRRMEEARRVAGVALADIGQLFGTAREKAQFDRVSYQPQEVAQIAEAQNQAETLFQQAQALFDRVEDAQISEARPTVEHYEQLTRQFGDVQQLAESARAALSQAEGMRDSLDRGMKPNIGET